MVSDKDIFYMRRAIELARGGMGQVSPNPMVGAVMVADGGRIIGEGFHRRFGGPHAEVNAVRSVADASLLRGATVYVTLEPCSHYGKTPPCADLLVDSGVGRVVVGAGDPNPRVAGRGIAILRDHGIEVTENVLADECRRLNAAFMTAHTLHRPLVTLKWAQSADGFIDIRRASADASPARFSSPLTQALVHRLRSLNDAILVGSGTVIADNPRLDVRLWPSGRMPQAILLDRRGRISSSAGFKVFTTESGRRPPVIIAGDDDLAALLRHLYEEHGITSLLVEGGATVHRAFIDAALWDAARVEKAPFRLGEQGGVAAPRLPAGIRPAATAEIDGRRLELFSNNSLVSCFAEM